jgi:hypothetical protein
MSRIEVPLVDRTLRTTGDVVLRAELDLELKTNHGTWVTVRFLVDPGTEMTTMMAGEARDRDADAPAGGGRVGFAGSGGSAGAAQGASRGNGPG